MRQRLYVLGGREVKHNNSNNNNNTARPTSSALEPVLEARSIRVLWAAWCDAVIAYSKNKDEDGDGGDSGGVEEPWPWVLEYIGAGLTTAQKKCLTADEDLKRAAPLAEAVLFGSAMHDGLRGYVVKSGNGDVDADGGTGAERVEQKIVLFGTDLEMEDGVPEIQTFLASESGFTATITDVKIDTSSCISLYTASPSTTTTTELILRFENFSHLRRYLSFAPQPSSPAPEVTCLPYTSPSRPQHVVNATTTTALDANMRVWTSTSDPRYPKCLGRSYDGGFDISPLPYLEESCIQKIAAGGYMSAAVSSDGELFVWGQACPGAGKELDVLKVSGVEVQATGIGVDEEQDEFVKCLDVRIDGQVARVYDVMVGHGHILVAAELCRMGEETKSVLFAAGDDSENQLGLETGADFKESFEEVASLRDKRIVQLEAAGWSTYAVLLEK
ncbi:unnamed protein product [Alternaria sp. RS040]